MSVDSATVTPGALNVTVPVNITLTEGDEVAGLNLTLSCNPTALEFQRIESGASATASNKELRANSPSAGVVKLLLYSMTPADFIQDGIIANVVFNVGSGASDGQHYDISVTECVLSNSDATTVSSTVSDGRITISTSGSGTDQSQGSGSSSGGSGCFISATN